MIILGKNFFYNNINNKTYEINICDSNKNINKIINYMNKYNNINDERIIGIDFEFNRSLDNTKIEIKLFQINLETNNDNAFIFMFYPPDLSNEQTEVLKKILLNEKTKTIIHGGESLDIPYLFNEFFKTDNEKENFCKNLYDTKYLCEYYNNSNKLN